MILPTPYLSLPRCGLTIEDLDDKASHLDTVVNLDEGFYLKYESMTKHFILKKERRDGKHLYSAPFGIWKAKWICWVHRAQIVSISSLGSSLGLDRRRLITKIIVEILPKIDRKLPWELQGAPYLLVYVGTPLAAAITCSLWPVAIASWLLFALILIA